MEVFVRKIEKSKWKKQLSKFKEDGEIKPFIITNEMKTCDLNTLSVYKADTEDIESIENAVLCLVESRQHLKEIDIALLNVDEVKKVTNKLNPDIPGKTNLDKYKNAHINIEDLSIEQIIGLSKLINEFVECENRKYSELQIIKLFVDRIEREEVEFSSLHDSFQMKISKKFPDRFQTCELKCNSCNGTGVCTACNGEGTIKQ